MNSVSNSIKTLSKTAPLNIAITSALLILTGCGSSNSSTEKASSSSAPAAPTYATVSELSTGSRSEPVTAYYDLDTGTIVDITEEEAATNTKWDIAFNRTKVYLNMHADAEATLYYTGNADSFYDEDGDTIADMFTMPDEDAISADFEAFDGSTVPTDAVFNGDLVESATNGFYNYDFMTHTVTANAEAYFVVRSDDGAKENPVESFAKFSVTNLTQDGFGMTDITLSISTQAGGETAFDAAEEIFVSAADCTGPLFIDVDSKSAVSESEDWELSIPCADGLADFAINLADGDTALFGASAEIDAVDMAGNQAYETWYTSDYSILALKEYGPAGSGYGWGEYGIEGGHTLWPNFATFVINTATANYKFQIISYYRLLEDETTQSGYYSFRFAPVSLP